MENLNNKEYLSFEVNNVTFAVPSSTVDSINNLDNITPVPHSHNEIDGITLFRDSTIPVFNLGKLLFNKPINNSEVNAIIANINNTKVAFVIDKVKNVLNVNKILDLPGIFDKKTIYVDNLIKDGNTIIQILNLNKIAVDYNLLGDIDE